MITDLLSRAANLAQLVTRGKPPVGTTPHDVVFTENKWRLLRYRPAPAALSGGRTYATPVLLVPSLINRHYVLDLLPGKSFAGWLTAQGHDVYIIDWGTPGPEDRYLGFDDICDRYLGRAIRVTARTAGASRVHLLGYCLGGTLTAIHAAAHPERVASLCALAAPIRFRDDGLLSAWTNSPSFDVDALVDACDNVPWPLMQASFHLLRPTLQLAKFVGLADRAGRAWNDEFLDGFLALETWGSDNVSFPGECYRRYIKELYRDDALACGTFRLSGRPADLANLRAPTLAVTFEHDNIVPWRSAAALIDLAGARDKQRIHLPGGHVGAVVSRAASQSLWPQLSAFFARHEDLADAADPPIRRASRPVDSGPQPAA